MRAFFTRVSKESPSNRTLEQWRDLAKKRGLHYDAWIDNYVPCVAPWVAPASAPPTQPPGTIKRAKRSAEELRALLHESQQPGATQAAMATKHGISRQAMNHALKNAKALGATLDNTWRALKKHP
jgi:hypothetical protein